MKRLIAIFALLTCSTLLLAQTSVPEELAGNWVGGIKQGADWTYMKVHLESSKCTIDMPLDFVTIGKPLADLQFHDGRASFVFRGPGKEWAFDGKVDDGTLTGTVAGLSAPATFRLRRIVLVDPLKYVGTYEVAPGHFLYIRQWVELDPTSLQFMDLSSGRAGTLYPLSNTEVFSGPSFLVTYPEEIHASFQLNERGEAEAITWKSKDTVMSGRKLHLREEQVTFQNGDVKLAGTLVLPSSPGLHPAIVFAHGSGPQPRGGAHLEAQFFALNGVAGLIYDKRGVGQSTGDWKKSSLEDLARDTAAGAKFLKTRADINGKEIGVWGPSQGGWIGPLAASVSKDIAFVISQSGPGVTPAEQELYRTEAWLRGEGYSDQDIQQALALERGMNDFVRTGHGWEELQAAAAKVKDAKWANFVQLPPSKDFWYIDFWRRIIDYDPVPVLSKLTVPTLVIFGENDTYVPVPKSVAIWEAALKKAGNKDYTIKVFPGAEHSIILSSGAIKDIPFATGFAPGYFSTQKDWVLKRVHVPARKQRSAITNHKPTGIASQAVR